MDGQDAERAREASLVGFAGEEVAGGLGLKQGLGRGVLVNEPRAVLLHRGLKFSQILQVGVRDDWWAYRYEAAGV